MARECPACASEIDRRDGWCPICGYEFPRRKPVIVGAAALLLLSLLVPLIVRLARLLGR